jgi:carbon-monoxide dehydrogenase large subunit
MVQVVADRLGVPMDDVVLARPDTATSPYGGGTAGSRSAVLGGAAAGEAAATMRVKLLTLGAHLLEAAPEDMTIEAGRISVRGTPSRSVSTAEVAQAALGGRFPAFLDAHLEVTARFRPERPTFSDATHICTCEVDAETGFVRLLRYVVSEDCGVMINPNVVHGQVAGGVVQGIGGVFYEHFDYDADGNPLSGTFMDYLLPTIGDVPTIEFGHTGVPAGSNPGGFKGLGEGGAIVSPPAIVNAVADALAPLGVVVPNQRLTPSDVFALISGAPGASAVAPRWASPTA